MHGTWEQSQIKITALTFFHQNFLFGPQNIKVDIFCLLILCPTIALVTILFLARHKELCLQWLKSCRRQFEPRRFLWLVYKIQMQGWGPRIVSNIMSCSAEWPSWPRPIMLVAEHRYSAHTLNRAWLQSNNSLLLQYGILEKLVTYVKVLTGCYTYFELKGDVTDCVC